MKITFVIAAALSFLLLSCAHHSTTAKKSGDVDGRPCSDKNKIYKTCSDQRAIFDEAVARAKRENKILFITFGADWCPWCQSLNRTFESPEFQKELAKKRGKRPPLKDRLIFAKIGVSHVVAGRKDRITGSYEIFDQIARDTASGEQKINGIPYLVFYNPNKQEAVFRDSGNLEKKGGKVAHDPKKILKAIDQAIQRW